MTLLVDPHLPEPLTLGKYKYQLKPATVTERTRWRRAVAAAGGRQHGVVGLLNSLATGVKVLMADSPAEVRDALLAKIEAQKDRVLAFYQAAVSYPAAIGENPSDAEKALQQEFAETGIAMNEGDAGLAVIVAEVSAFFPAYPQMVADEATYWEFSGIEACRMFLVGWEGFELPLARGIGGVSDECLAEIPETHFTQIGKAFENLTKITPQQRKNSNSPRPSSSAGETLNT